MVSRRGLLGGAAAAAAVLLGGCGRGGRKLVEVSEEAATAVAGVSSAQLELVDGATFERLLRGTVTLEASDRDSGLEIFDEAMRGIITILYDQLDDSEASSLRVGGIIGSLSDGEKLTPLDLDPEMTAANPRLDRVTAGSFSTKYGVG